MEMLEDNIVSVSRQMIDKEASVPSAGLPAGGHAHGVNGSSLAQRLNGGGQVMEIDDDEI